MSKVKHSRCFRPLALWMSVAAGALQTLAAAQPLQLLPENPHYFLFRGEKTLIHTSGEHYSSVLNPVLNYTPHLDTLSRDGLNPTSTWLGACINPEATFKTRFAKGESSLEVALPSGKFTKAWFNPKTGTLTPSDSLSLSSGFHTLAVPAFEDDIALVIRAIK